MAYAVHETYTYPTRMIFVIPKFSLFISQNKTYTQDAKTIEFNHARLNAASTKSYKLSLLRLIWTP